MHEENRPAPIQSDYISLSSLKKAILDFFSVVFRIFEFLAHSIRRGLPIFLVCSALGLVSGYLYYLLNPEKFVAEMIVNHSELTRKEFYEILNNLNNQLITQDYMDLQNELGVKQEVVENIRYITAVKMDGGSLEKDTSLKTGQPFKIQFTFRKVIPTAALQQGVLDYLNNKSYLKLRKEGQKKIFIEKLTFIDQEQKRLDSLKTAYNQALVSSKMSATFYNNAMNPAEIYVQSNNLANQRESILRWLNNESESVVLLDGLKRPLSTRRISLKEALIIGLSGGMVLGVIMTILASIYRIVKTRSYRV